MKKTNSNLLNILLVSRSGSSAGLGGPVWTMKAIMKHSEENPQPGITFKCVFSDGFFDSYSTLPPSEMNKSQTWWDASSYLKRAVLSMPLLLRSINRAVKRSEGSIIFHCHDFISAYLCRLRFGKKYPIIMTIHAKGGGVKEVISDYPSLKKNPLIIIAKYVERSSVEGAKVVVFPSSGAMELFKAEHQGLLDNNKMRVINTGIEFSTITKIPDDNGIREKYSVPHNNHLLYSIAAMVHEKGLDTLIEAVSKLPKELLSQSTCLIVARQGPLKEQLESMIKLYHLENIVRFLGFMPREDMVQLLKQSTLFILPSRVAIFDIVLLEASIANVPVITSAVGGNLEIYDSSSAFLIPPNDPKTLSDTIVKALDDSSLRNQVALSASNRISKLFSFKAFINNYTDLYKTLINENTNV